MKKFILIIVVIVLAIAGYYFYFTSYKSIVDDEKGAPMVGASTVEFEGEIKNINKDAIALDGPTVITVSSGNTETYIAVPSMGINLCAAKNNIVDVFTLKVGDKVSVSGVSDDQGRIVPCEDTSHYLRVVKE
jgi:hypothetical protein